MVKHFLITSKAERQKIFDILHKRKVITTSKVLTINKFRYL